jgi:uncharacterized membrane protein YphA (DoxX/SURF4 family)
VNEEWNLRENRMSTISRSRWIAGWVLTGLLTALFLASSAGKLAGAEQVVKMMGEWGLGKYVLLIGVGELVSALLFVIPKTHSLGALLLSGYMGGAIVTHMQHGEPFIMQSVILALIWVAGYLRYPELLQSFRVGKPATAG